MKKITWATFLICLGVSCCASGQIQGADEQLSDKQRSSAGEPMSSAARADSATPVFSLQNLKRDTRVLSSDAFEGRGPLSVGEDKTVAYVTAAMKKAGLMPAFNGGYTQPVPL